MVQSGAKAGMVVYCEFGNIEDESIGPDIINVTYDDRRMFGQFRTKHYQS